MDCQTPFVISLFGMMFFAGYAIGCLVIPPFGDRNGRKKIFVACLCVEVVAFTGMLLLPGHDEKYMWALVFLMFVSGL